jgi:hypothetical protein
VRKLAAVVGLTLALGACSKASNLVASPTASVDPSNPLGCDFKMPKTPKAQQLTQATIDETVAAAPAAIRDDLRTIYDVSRRYQEAVKAAQAAPKSEQPARLAATAKELNNDRYRAAAQRVRDYLAQHCTAYKVRPSSSP